MVFKRFVESGRIALVNTGSYNGKLVVIVDVIDHNRVLCDNPSNNVPRQTINLKHLNLTDLKISVPHGARTACVRKAFDKEEVNAKWEKTAWAQRLERRVKRASLSDFDRFKVKVAKQRKNRPTSKKLIAKNAVTGEIAVTKISQLTRFQGSLNRKRANEWKF
ncbi:large ribosomal subunit protein eL14-like isoform X1 [Rhopilema esculentum]|uniref:large ribosomal subunit protein eL14-like isoform X1 n=1 Tax=Rhopilema esculentum TaxID=499914 RepID=UPI0031D07F6C